MRAWLEPPTIVSSPSPPSAWSEPPPLARRIWSSPPSPSMVKISRSGESETVCVPGVRVSKSNSEAKPGDV